MEEVERHDPSPVKPGKLTGLFSSRERQYSNSKSLAYAMNSGTVFAGNDSVRLDGFGTSPKFRRSAHNRRSAKKRMELGRLGRQPGRDHETNGALFLSFIVCTRSSEKFQLMSRLQHVAGTHLGVAWACWGEGHEVAAYLHCRIRHGYRDRGSKPARLGGSSGGCVKPPGPCQIDGRTGGAHYFFLLVARGPFGGCEGDWAHPRAAITHAPRGAYPLKNKTGAPKFTIRRTGRAGRVLSSGFCTMPGRHRIL